MEETFEAQRPHVEIGSEEEEAYFHAEQ